MKLQVLNTKDEAKVKEQFLKMVHSLFVQVPGYVNCHFLHEYLKYLKPLQKGSGREVDNERQ